MTTQPARHHQLPELLHICEEFFAHTSPATRHELDTFLRARGNHGGPGWLIDMLAVTRARLTGQLEHPTPQQPHP
jgi:hypothetical protein